MNYFIIQICNFRYVITDQIRDKLKRLKRKENRKEKILDANNFDD